MKSFCFEHVFRAPSTAAVFAAYFDPDHLAIQDQRLDIIERTVVERTETDDELLRVSRIVPRRQLPAIMRPLVSGQLHYIERARWRKRDDEIDLEIAPSILRGRASITVVYRLVQTSSDTIHRSYGGSVSVDVALISSKIEHKIVAEIGRSMPIAAASTQEWLDRVAPPEVSVSPRT